MTTLRIVCLSDTHGQHDEVDVPDGDLFLHAGDISTRGRLDQIAVFNRFLGQLPHPHKIIIAGNHDFGFEKEAATAQAMITNAIYLQDDWVEIENVKIYGTPWQPEFHNWAFNLKRGAELRAKWEMIPADTDILITHGPPMGVLDKTWSGAEVGCEDLLNRVEDLRPKLHLFGHIHEAAGRIHQDGIWYVNASIVAGVLKGMLKKLNRPVVFDIETDTKEITLIRDE